jgi:GNAT superfamily N-acetyltransferase
MSREDFEFAMQVTDLMDWDFSSADFEFMTALEPEGCFVLVQGTERIGIATTITFGRVAWFGNLVVAPGRREGGGGTLLVKHALNYLRGKDVKTVGLYAYSERIPFYTRLGFHYDADFTVMKGAAPPTLTLPPSVREAGPHEAEEIVGLDQQCFGESRRKLLDPLFRDSANLCHVHMEGGGMSGFALTKVYNGAAELGPLACSRGRPDIATDLLIAALSRLKGFEVSMCIPKKETAMQRLLTTLGFTERFRVARMFFGPPIPSDCIYAAESLERG